MPNLTIAIQEDVWPDVVVLLQERFGPVPDDVRARDWAEQIAVKAFSDLLATPPPKKSRRSRRART
jgi:hypothetical protein